MIAWEVVLMKQYMEFRVTAKILKEVTEIIQLRCFACGEKITKKQKNICDECLEII